MLITHSSSPSLDHASNENRARLLLPMPVLLVVWIYFTMTLLGALSSPFPTIFDELQHYSVIRAQFEDPALFPDWSRYLLLRESDLTHWSQTPNYINHPSLYYLLLAPLMGVTSNPLVFRVIDVLLSTGALTIVAVAVHRRVPGQIAPPALFAVMAASFPKAMVVGGIVNNDNLAAMASAVLFAGLVGLQGEAWWIAAGLAIAGWTKLTALIALSTVVCAWLGVRVISGSLKPWDRIVLFAGAGVTLGAIPYLVTYMRTGHALWVSEAAWRVPTAERAHLDLAGFSEYFLKLFVLKWPASEGLYSYPVAIVGLLTPLLLAAMCMRERVLRPLTMAYAVGVSVLFTIHLAFGWRSFQELGDLTIAQTRYYNVLWPGIALAATTGASRLSQHWKPAKWVAAVICLSPTVLGGIVAVSL